MKDQFNNEYTLYIKYHKKFYGYAFEYFIKYIKTSDERLSFIDSVFKDNYIMIQHKDNKKNHNPQC